MKSVCFAVHENLPKCLAAEQDRAEMVEMRAEVAVRLEVASCDRSGNVTVWRSDMTGMRGAFGWSEVGDESLKEMSQSGGFEFGGFNSGGGMLDEAVR